MDREQIISSFSTWYQYTDYLYDALLFQRIVAVIEANKLSSFFLKKKYETFSFVFWPLYQELFHDITFIRPLQLRDLFISKIWITSS